MSSGAWCRVCHGLAHAERVLPLSTLAKINVPFTSASPAPRQIPIDDDAVISAITREGGWDEINHEAIDDAGRRVSSVRWGKRERFRRVRLRSHCAVPVRRNGTNLSRWSVHG